MFILLIFLFVGNELPVLPVLGLSEDFIYCFGQFYGWREVGSVIGFASSLYIFESRSSSKGSLNQII